MLQFAILAIQSRIDKISFNLLSDYTVHSRVMQVNIISLTIKLAYLEYIVKLFYIWSKIDIKLPQN